MSAPPADFLAPPDAKRQKSNESPQEPSADPAERLRVVFLLDITGSMSSQITGVKEMVKKFCEREQEGRALAISIMTYTENSKRGYVSHFTSTNKRELASYVSDIQLSRPPDHRHENACGDDG